jgi:hypothetical protein
MIDQSRWNECETLDEMAAEIVRTYGACEEPPGKTVVLDPPSGVPSICPTGFVVELGAGWAGPLHGLADAMRVWVRGPEAAAGVLLSWLWFVEYEAEGVPECRDLVEGMQVLKGAVMTTGVEAAGGVYWNGIIVNLIVNPIVNPFRPVRT